MNAPSSDWRPALTAMIDRSERALAKLAPGTSQHSLLTHRIRALRLALSLPEEGTGSMTAADPASAAVPLASLLSKSEKALTKLKPDSWQHAMLERNVAALHVAIARISEATFRLPSPEGR